ncbi:MAG: NAD(P)H-hydrate dehydratase [Candidatus Hydrogenedentes bacterium]|nr:NAD(P)H-hydrate dehydratase [Candidatus Hydrogenedentota bacterium]
MAELLTRAQVRALLPARADDAHKGAFGHLLVLAGSRNYMGAAKLTCRAAQRSGVGLVTCGVPYPLANVFSASELETMCLRLPATEEESIASAALEPALRFARQVQAVVLGPGLSSVSGTRDFVHQFTQQCPVPLAIDADGLNALAERPATLDHRAAAAVITPHPGEMARLIHGDIAAVQRDRASIALEFSAQHQCVTVLKGHHTVIAAPDGRLAINGTGNHGLAKGGSGDILAGLLGGLLAQGVPAFDASCIAVFVHGLAADLLLAESSARGMTALDLIAALPKAWRGLESGDA